MNNPDLNASLAATFKGAASLTLRYANFEQYQQGVMLFRAALGQPDPVAPPINPPSTSIRISEAMELLCMYQPPDLVTDCTIVYWAVGTEPDQMESACTMLVSKGYQLLEAPGTSPLGSGDKENTQRAVLQDEAGHQIGLIINPPVPLTDSR